MNNEEKRNELFSKIKALIPPDNKNIYIIAVDGGTMVGKSSYITRPLAAFLENSAYISFDDENKKLSEAKDGEYVINVENLKSEIESLSKTHKIIILDSILMMDVLCKLNLVPELFIYVKKMGHDENWLDSEIYSGDKKLETVLEQFDPHNVRHKMNIQLINYHYEYNPQNSADFIFEKEIED